MYSTSRPVRTQLCWPLTTSRSSTQRAITLWRRLHGYGYEAQPLDERTQCLIQWLVELHWVELMFVFIRTWLQSVAIEDCFQLLRFVYGFFFVCFRLCRVFCFVCFFNAQRAEAQQRTLISKIGSSVSHLVDIFVAVTMAHWANVYN